MTKPLTAVFALGVLWLAPAVAPAQSGPELVLELAKQLTPAGNAAACLDHTPTASDRRTRSCRIALSATPEADTIIVSFFTADSVMLQLDQRLTDTASREQFVRRIDEFATRHTLTRRDCGHGESPAGATRGHLWHSGRLLVSLIEITNTDAAPRAGLLAISPPTTYPIEQLCRGQDHRDR